MRRGACGLAGAGSSPHAHARASNGSGPAGRGCHTRRIYICAGQLRAVIRTEHICIARHSAYTSGLGEAPPARPAFFFVELRPPTSAPRDARLAGCEGAHIRQATGAAAE